MQSSNTVNTLQKTLLKTIEEKREQIIQKTLEKNIEKTTEKITTIEMKREHTILNTVENTIEKATEKTEKSLLYSREDSQLNIEKNFTTIRLLRREEYQLNSQKTHTCTHITLSHSSADCSLASCQVFAPLLPHCYLPFVTLSLHLPKSASIYHWTSLDYFLLPYLGLFITNFYLLSIVSFLPSLIDSFPLPAISSDQQPLLSLASSLYIHPASNPL